MPGLPRRSPLGRHPVCPLSVPAAALTHKGAAASGTFPLSEVRSQGPATDVPLTDEPPSVVSTAVVPENLVPCSQANLSVPPISSYGKRIRLDLTRGRIPASEVQAGPVLLRMVQLSSTTDSSRKPFSASERSFVYQAENGRDLTHRYEVIFSELFQMLGVVSKFGR